MEGGGELTAYEQERQRRLEENRRKLEEMGLQQVGSERLTPFERELERRWREGPHLGRLPLCDAALPRAPTAAPAPRRTPPPLGDAGTDSPALRSSSPALLCNSCPQMVTDIAQANGGQQEAKKKREKKAPEEPLEPTRRWAAAGGKGGKACMAGWGHLSLPPDVTLTSAAGPAPCEMLSACRGQEGAAAAGGPAALHGCACLPYPCSCPAELPVCLGCPSSQVQPQRGQGGKLPV